MLQTMKRLPGTPRRKTKLRMRAPKAVEKSLLTTLSCSGFESLLSVELELFMIEGGLILRAKTRPDYNQNTSSIKGLSESICVAQDWKNCVKSVCMLTSVSEFVIF